MNQLYPEISVNQHGFLSVDERHQLYIEESGNPDGIPVVFLHGGPGSGCDDVHRCFFDPNVYRIILFDQRGSGRSKPHASLQDNTTGHLIQDIEKVRQYFGVDQWMVFGGSWGVTLALAYAQTHADRVLAMVLRGVFLCRDEEIDWFYQRGASRVYADYWEDFIAPIEPELRDDLLSAYYDILTGKDEIKRLSAARSWSIWEGRTASLLPNKYVVNHYSSTHTALSLARIECHYFKHKAFLEPNQLLHGMPEIEHIPSIIVQGRYDLICPMESAWALHKVWPKSQLKIVSGASHSAFEPGITHELIAATNYFAKALK